MGTVPSFPYRPSTDFASQVNPQQEDPNSALLKELSKLRQEQDTASAQNQATLDAGTAKIDSYFNDRMTKLEAIRNDVMKPKEITPQQILGDLVKMLAAGFLGRNPALAVGLSGLGNLVKTSDPKFQEYEQRQKFGKELMDQFLQEGNARGNALLQQVGLSVNNANAALGRKTDLATAGLNLQGDIIKDKTNKQFQAQLVQQEHFNRLSEQQTSAESDLQKTLTIRNTPDPAEVRKDKEAVGSGETLLDSAAKAAASEVDPNNTDSGKLNDTKVVIGSPEFETFINAKYKEAIQGINDTKVLSNMKYEDFRNKVYDEVKARGWFKEKFSFRRLHEQIDSLPEDKRRAYYIASRTNPISFVQRLTEFSEALKTGKLDPNALYSERLSDSRYDEKTRQYLKEHNYKVTNEELFNVLMKNMEEKLSKEKK